MDKKINNKDEIEKDSGLNISISDQRIDGVGPRTEQNTDYGSWENGRHEDYNKWPDGRPPEIESVEEQKVMDIFCRGKDIYDNANKYGARSTNGKGYSPDSGNAGRGASHKIKPNHGVGSKFDHTLDHRQQEQKIEEMDQNRKIENILSNSTPGHNITQKYAIDNGPGITSDRRSSDYETQTLDIDNNSRDLTCTPKEKDGYKNPPSKTKTSDNKGGN